MSVYGWGIGEDGQLGTGETVNLLVPQNIDIPSSAHVVQIATDDGRVLSCGSGAQGQLGHGNTGDELRAARIDSLQSVVIVRAACGAQHSVVLSSEGEVYTFGLGEFGQLGYGGTAPKYIPYPVQTLRKRNVVQLACGWGHSVALTASGDVYAWGRGFEGQLGLGEDQCALTPRYVAALDGVVITYIACGINFTAAVTSNGELYVWGDGSSGQIGRGGQKSERAQSARLPVRVDALLHVKISKVACGWGHIVALTEQGEAYIWGFNMHGQLGTNSNSSQYSPEASLDPLPGGPILDVACGDHFTLALTENGDVFSWGNGKGGRLGHGDEESASAPRLISALRGLNVQSLATGWRHSLVVIPK